MMMPLLAGLLSAIILAIAVLHAGWGLGSHWPAASEEALAKAAVGTRGVRRMPGPVPSLIVAALLAAIAIWPLLASGLLPDVLPRWLLLPAGAAIAAVFLARGVAGYTAAWRRHFPEQPFARLDRRYYSPLCLALGAGTLVTLIAGITS